jgi:hypothetical protein
VLIDLHGLTLASRRLERMSLLVVRRVPFKSELERHAVKLTGKIDKLEWDSRPRRQRRIYEACLLVARCAAHFDMARPYLPAELFQQGKELLAFMMGELEKLQKEKGAPISRGRPSLLN